MKKVDVFPAIIYIAPPKSVENPQDLNMTGERPQGTRKLDRCRVVVFNSKIHVAVDSPEGPKVVFREALIEYFKDATGNSHHAVTESGKIIVFDRDNNCGCGSRLRSWNPFGGHLGATGDPDE